MTALTLLVCRAARRRALGLGAAGLLALAGCRSDKEPAGAGVGRKNDPLVAGPGRLIPKQDLPVPDRGVGSKGKGDPLTSPTGRGAGYTDDPERFKGTVLPGKGSTPASLAGRLRDPDELRIDDAGVKLQPAPGAVPADAGEGVSGLFERLEKMGARREDWSLGREGDRYVFRLSKPISAAGARLQYTGEADTAADAVKQVVEQLAADRK